MIDTLFEQREPRNSHVDAIVRAKKARLFHVSTPFGSSTDIFSDSAVAVNGQL
jgi:hypothetical protein